MKVVLVSLYELGRQPFGLASPAAWLRQAGFEVECVDVSRTPLREAAIRGAGIVALYLPMHTATRLAVPAIERVRQWNPQAHLCCYGLYAPLNEKFLRSLGADTILGGEFEADLLALARHVADLKVCATAATTSGGAGLQAREADRRVRPTDASGSSFRVPRSALPRLQFLVPDRRDLPPLERYAKLRVGSESRVVGYTEASRGCKHLCRHCPVVPIYQGRFRVVPSDVVLADIRAQVEAGAQHITFGDPDFFNGIRHAVEIVSAMARELPGVTYDVTIKIEHLLRHARHLKTLRETGCLFITSAVEALDDRVLALLDKGHTRADFVRAVDLCRDIGLPLSPTFIAFHPWTTLDGYGDLLATIAELQLVEHVAPIQLAIRLLIPEGSRLLELPEIRRRIGPFDPSVLTYPWRHPDPRVDALHAEVNQIVGSRPDAPRGRVFDAVRRLTDEYIGAGAAPRKGAPYTADDGRLDRAAIPYLTEPWYC